MAEKESEKEKKPIDVHIESKGRKEGGDEVEHDEHKKKNARKKEEPSEEFKRALEERDRQIEELKEKILYQQADFENFKRLKAKEKQDVLRFGNETLVKELLPVIDNLERAIEHASKAEEAKGITEGVLLTLNGFLNLLHKFQVERVEAIGQKFDPNVHEAVYQEGRSDIEPGMVVGEFQKGYVMDGRLLRPAMVSVAKAPEKE
jgi:molecular chaperone GrpE